jgi:hypothetical protein
MVSAELQLFKDKKGYGTIFEAGVNGQTGWIQIRRHDMPI